MNLIQNITGNFTLLRDDFIGFSVSFSGIGQFFLHLLIAASIFLIFYLFGEKIRKIFFRENKKFNFFVNIALGCIVIGTGVGILGVFSLLQPEILFFYLGLAACIALVGIRRRIGEGKRWIRRIRWIRAPGKANVIIWGVLLFVLIGFLRLMTPEITEDAYHTDLPRLYLASGTTIHETKEPLHVIPYPQLPEMIYMLPILLGDKESARFVHFGFYLLIVSLLFSFAKSKENSFAKFAPILFVTAPMMIRYSSSQYTDFFAVFFFLLAVLLIEKKMSTRQMILAGLILGAVFSVKLWMLVYLPVFLLYIIILNRKQKLKNLVTLLCTFCLASFSIAMLWYIRSFMITGNPIYPVLAKMEYLEVDATFIAPASNYIGFNWNMFLFQNMVVYSPLFFLGVISLIFIFRKAIVSIKNSPLFLFFMLLMVEQLVINVAVGRYLLALYTIATVIASAGIVLLMRVNITRYMLILFYFILFSYYFLNTVFTLPYGFGWADKNAYLTRILGRDNASYYDFDHLFNKWIQKEDFVATYGIYGYYYANFSYIDINYIFSKKDRSFELLKKKGVTKLLVKGGDVGWFCKQLSLTHCDTNKVQLLATWPADVKKYNLYTLK